VIIKEASDDLKTIQIEWMDGTTVILAPDEDSSPEPRINTTKTVNLTTDWSYFGHNDTLALFPSALRVTNKSGNPGSIDVKIVNDRVLATTTYYFSLEPGYTGTLDDEPYPYDIYLRACSIAGSYRIKATDWII